jgi:hypothetical protein
MEKIILNKGEILEDKIYINKKIEIICKGNNIIKNCIFSNIINEKFIILSGEEIMLKSNQFLEMKHKDIFVFYDVNKLSFLSNLFWMCNFEMDIINNFTIFHKNRFENCFGEIILNSFNNHFINNELVNNVNFFITLKKKKNIICFNFFDYKCIKNSKAIIIKSNDNLIQGNQFLNIDFPITIYEANNNDLFDNDFSSSKIIFTCDFKFDGMKLNLNIENNNFIKYNKKFNKKKYEKEIHIFNNVEDEELMKTVIEIGNVNEEMNQITDKRLIRKIKEVKKKEAFINDLNKKELIKILNIERKLNELLKLSEDLKNTITKMKNELF